MDREDSKLIADIQAKVSAFRNNTTYTRLKSRWETDFKLFKLDPYNAGTGYFSYTSNAPRLLANKLVTMLDSAELSIHVPDDVLTDKEQNTANNVERFLYGALAQNDERMTIVPQTPSLRQQIAWYAALRGTVVVCVYVYKNSKGETCTDVMPWDIYNTSYGMDEEGVTWGANSYKVSNEFARKNWDIETSYADTNGVVGGDIEVTNFWDREKYLTFAAGQWVAKPIEHECKKCPVFILPVGATPLIWQNNDPHTGIYVGESVYSHIRDLIPILNKTMSDRLTLLRRGVKAPIAVFTDEQESPITEDIWQVEKGGVVKFAQGDDVKPLIPQTMPADTDALLGWVSGEIQRGGLPHTAYGELNFRLSGFAINLLYAAHETVLDPLVTCLEQTYQRVCLELLSQFATKTDLPAIKVRGRTSKNEPFGYPKAMPIKPTDIDGDWHPEIKLNPTLPTDDAQKLALAKQAREGEIPLLSDETVRKTYLGVKDEDLERKKIDKEWAEHMVINRLWKAYLGAVEAGDSVVANNILMEVKRLMIGQSPAAPKGNGGAAPSPTEGLVGMMGGAGMPPGATGMPSSVMPPESLGGMPPGATNANTPPMEGY